jgi:hypothetical protein
MGGHSKVSLLESQSVSMMAKVAKLETTLNKATSFVVDLSTYNLSLPAHQAGTPTSLGATVPLKEFLAFKAAQSRSLASIRQDLKGGAVEIGGFIFYGKDACMAFACTHMTREPTYHCIPSLMFAMCMPSDEVIYKRDMQGDEIHMARTSQNPMQSAVILSVNSTISAILEGPKDSIREAKYDFNAAQTFEEWMLARLGGTSKNFRGGVVWAFEQIKGAINLTLGDPLAKSVMLKLHGEFLMHFWAIFTTELTGYYHEILGKTGSPPPHNKEVKAACWALVTKLLTTIFKEIHKV